MEKKVRIKYVRMSPKKLRFLLDNFKHKNAQEVLNSLKLNINKGAGLLYKAVKSGLSLFADNERENVMVKNILVDKGPMFKRWMPGGRGMAKKYVKHTAHIEVVLEAEEKKIAKVVKKDTKENGK